MPTKGPIRKSVDVQYLADVESAMDAGALDAVRFVSSKAGRTKILRACAEVRRFAQAFAGIDGALEGARVKRGGTNVLALIPPPPMSTEAAHGV